MQGNLNEIDIRSILQLIELGQRTGELFVEAYSSPSATLDLYPQVTRPRGDRAWFVFFFNGQLVYAADRTGSNLSRLRDYLHRYKLDDALSDREFPDLVSTNAPEYGYLWALLEKHVLTPAQGRSIIKSMLHETLFDLLGLHQGAFIFEMGSALAPQLMTLPIEPLVAKIIKQVQEWKQFHPHIQSPDQCPIVSDPEALREALPENTFKTVTRWADGHTSIRQMARYLNRDILTVARAIYPYVQQGLVQLSHLPSQPGSPAQPPSSGANAVAQPLRVMCIDDDVTVGKIVESMLSERGYRVSAINNPLKSFGVAFQRKPHLILCDIAMPEPDGYEICAMLRRSTAFRQVPIVMLTGKDGFIDRVKARMVGATDYLTKPFGEQELVMLVEKYIGASQATPSSSEPSTPNSKPDSKKK